MLYAYNVIPLSALWVPIVNVRLGLYVECTEHAVVSRHLHTVAWDHLATESKHEVLRDGSPKPIPPGGLGIDRSASSFGAMDDNSLNELFTREIDNVPGRGAGRAPHSTRSKAPWGQGQDLPATGFEQTIVTSVTHAPSVISSLPCLRRPQALDTRRCRPLIA